MWYKLTVYKYRINMHEGNLKVLKEEKDQL